MSGSGYPPPAVANLLRLDGLAVLVAAVAAFVLIGGNWILFVVLILAPDLAFLAMPLGTRRAAMVYNIMHSYVWPIVLGLIGYFAGTGWLLQVALIWAAHIGGDRALGYGLKYPDAPETTHLGLIGKARRMATSTDR
jgi:hypothetical protein